MKRLVLLVVLVAATACGDAAFVATAGMQATSPVNLDPVRLPVEIAWTAPDDDTTERIEAGERFYVVFLDRPPIAPGESLTTLVDDDCERDAACPNIEYFGDRGVFVTRQPVLLLPRMTDRRTSDRDGATDRHIATVIVADAEGVRHGEVNATIRFVVDRENG